MPTPRLPGGSWSMGAPSTSTRPASALMKPATVRSSVVLPQPEGPRSARISLGATLSVTSRTASVWP
jgi:hypothetical protein